MLRNQALIPLSHQHQRALALCVRIDRAQPIRDADLPIWQAEIAQLFAQEIRFHFGAEEDVLFPGAQKFDELTALIDDLLAQHSALRDFFSRAEARSLSQEDLQAFGQKMSSHIRLEERQLFERIQGLMSSEEMAVLGKSLESCLRDATHSCALPKEATKLRPGN